MSTTEQWNEGLPPAGEVGMCYALYEGRTPGFAMWRGEFFTAHHGVTAAARALSCQTRKDGEFERWRWATLADPGVTAEMLHSSQREPEWSEWIEWNGGECPIPGAKAGEYAIRMDGQEHVYEGEEFDDAATWVWADQADGKITSYRLRLSAAPKQDAPWLPPQQPGFGPWRECDGTCPPEARKKTVEVLNKRERDWRFYNHSPLAVGKSHDIFWHMIAAYCVKLEPAQAQAEPVQRYMANPMILSSATVVLENCYFYGDGSNDPMLQRDDDGAEPTRRRPLEKISRATIAAMCSEMLRESRDEAVAEQALVEHGFDHRFGKFV